MYSGKMEKTKKLKGEIRNGELERRGKRSCGIQSPEYQELSAAAAATPLITLKSSETQNVDLADKVRANVCRNSTILVRNEITSLASEDSDRHVSAYPNGPH
jgi:hypothetical protein